MSISSSTSKIINDIKEQIARLDQQIEELEKVRIEKNRLKKILNLMTKEDTGIKQIIPASGITKMVYEGLEEIGDSNCNKLVAYLTEQRNVPLSNNLPDLIRSALHRLNKAKKIVSPSHGVWKVIEEKTPQKKEGLPSINEILNPPPLIAGNR